MIPFSLIVAVDINLGIGKSGSLPWHLPADLKYFKKVTTHSSAPGQVNAVIMGRKTWESIPLQFRPLPQRFNVVISRQHDFPVPPGTLHAASLQKALQSVEKENVREIFVIGGAQVFQEAVLNPGCQKIYLTRIEKEFSCDAFFPDVLHQFTAISHKGPILESNIPIWFYEYVKIF